jgi:hypothetical protein
MLGEFCIAEAKTLARLSGTPALQRASNLANRCSATFSLHV